MKTTINRSLFFLLILFSSFIPMEKFLVQENEVGTLIINRDRKQVVLRNDTVACFTSFVVIPAEQKNYLTWNVKEQKLSGYYVIERGIDGVNFDFLGVKQGTGTNLIVQLMYCFTDKEPLPGINYYRVTHFAENNTFMLTEVIQVMMPSDLEYTIGAH